MYIRVSVIAILMLCVPFGHVRAQDSFEEFRKRNEASFNQFRNKVNSDYQAFRKKVNEEYAAFVERAWKEYRSMAGKPVPEDNVRPVPPVVCPKEDEGKPQPKPEPLPYDEVVTPPQPKPQPQPVAPVEPVRPVVRTLDFTFFGTRETVRFDKQRRVTLGGADERSIAAAWREMAASDDYAMLVNECLRIRDERGLCDWAYLKMLQTLGLAVYGTECNDARLLTAFVYCQSGYKMRLARTRGNELHMLIASEHEIYDVMYFNLDGCRFYALDCNAEELSVCAVEFPNETAMSLYLPTPNKFAVDVDGTCTRQSKRYPEVKTTLAVNVNLMKFYDTYPTSTINDNVMTRWAMYANTPMATDVSRQLYPPLREAIKGCSQLTAVNKLLNYVQTGFEYEYDDKVWGHDRAFFAEESLYYPYCDCEDRSILFTRLVRDLLGLRCILIYYPGHLAAAVEFTESGVSGDWIKTGGHTFTVTDPTFIGAPVGRTMTGMSNQTAKVIILE